MIISCNPNERGMALWKVVFQSYNPYGKKCSIKDTMSIKISFMHQGSGQE